MFKKKESKIKVEFTVTIHSLKNIPSAHASQLLYVEGKRGAKPKNHFVTKKVNAQGSTATWEEKFKVQSTFFEDPKTKKVDQKAKNLSLTLRGEEDKADKKSKKSDKDPIGKGSINLTDYVEPGTIRHESLTLKTDKRLSIAPTLMIKVETTWIKLNDKKLVKKVEVKASSEQPETKQVKIGNEEFTLQTADEITESHASVSDEEEEEDFQEDEEESVKKSSSIKSSSRTTSSSSINKEPQQVNNELPPPYTSDMKKNHENEIKDIVDKYSAEIEDLQSDKERLERKVNRLQSRVDELSNALENAKKSSEESSNQDNTTTTIIKSEPDPAILAELEELKSDNSVYMIKLDKLTKELEDKKSQAENDKLNYQKLQDQFNKLNQEHQQQQHQLQQYQQQQSDQASSKKKKESELQKEIDNLKKEIDQLKKSNKESQDTISKQKEQIDKLKSESSKQQQVVAVDSVAKDEDKKRLEDKISTLERENSDLKKSREEMEKKYDDKLTGSQQKIKLLELEIESQKKDSDSTISQLNKRISELENEIRKKDESIKSNNEIGKNAVAEKESLLNKEIDNLSIQVKSLMKDTEEKSKKMEELNDKLSKSESSLKESKSTTEKVKHELEISKKKINEEEKNKESLEKVKHELEKEVKELKHQIENIKSEHENVKKKGEDDETKKVTAKRQLQEIETLRRRVQQLALENQQHKLIESSIYSISEPEYDSNVGIPVSVASISDSMISWNSFDPVQQEFLSNLLHAIKKSFAKSVYDSDGLAYWLSVTCHLFIKLKNDIIPNDKLSINNIQDIILNYIKNPESLKSLSNSNNDSEDNNDNEEINGDIDPIIKFIADLATLSFDIYSVLLINIYGQIDNILVPIVIGSNDKSSTVKKVSVGDVSNVLCEIIKSLQKNYIPESVTKLFLHQLFYFMDSQIFNTFLKRNDLFNATYGFQLKMAISQVENSIGKSDKQLVTVAHSEFKHIKEAANLLVMDKSILSDEDILHDAFENLNYQQIKYLLEKFRPDDLSPEPVPGAVREKISALSDKQKDEQLQLEPTSIKHVNLFEQL